MAEYRRHRARLARGLALALTAGAVATGPLAPAGPAGAQAAEPFVVTVTPATGLTARQVVEVTLGGAIDPASPAAIVQCDAAVGDAPTLEESLDLCANEAVADADGTTNYTVYPTLRSFTGNRILCGDAPGDCVIAAADGSFGRWGSAPIDIAPSPLVVEPEQFVDPAAGVTALVAGEAGTTVRLAQCAAPVAGTLAASRCGPTLDVAVPAAGRAEAHVPLAAVLDLPDGPVDCVATDCAVASFAADGTGIAHVLIQLRQPLSVWVDPSAGLLDGARVNALVAGWRDEPVVVEQCAAAVAGSGAVTGGPCTTGGPAVAAGGDPANVGLRVRRSFIGADGTGVTCDEPGSCVVAVGGAAGRPVAVAPLTFGPPPVATVSPATGLLDGQVVTLAASGLVPGASYSVLRCWGPADGSTDECEPLVPALAVTSTPSGDVAAEVAVAQRLRPPSTRDRYCRDDCALALSPAGSGDVAAHAPYALAAGAVTAAPAAGLADGDPVTVTFTDVQPSYDGPPVWVFGSGAWGLGQCGAGVLDDPTIVGVLTHCASVPGGGAVALPSGPVTVSAAASLTPFLAPDRVDCTAAAGACVVALTRVESDGSVSLLAAPLAFGT
jgi:hypothetical protein